MQDGLYVIMNDRVNWRDTRVIPVKFQTGAVTGSHKYEDHKVVAISNHVDLGVCSYEILSAL